MRVLIGKTFGIGNACLTVPLVKAISSLGHTVDILVGNGPDDFGALEVFRELRRQGNEPVINKIFYGGVPFSADIHDVAIMAIPYDGRWRNGIDFFARAVMDCRKRPRNVERLGFDMWEKHEVEYLMENAIELGFRGQTPDGSFIETIEPSPLNSDTVYLGLGYKRDPGGFGETKHFGNHRYAELIDLITGLHPSARFVSSGPIPDMVNSRDIVCHDSIYDHILTSSDGPGLQKSFDLVSRCRAYVGNDTGMMHVAASIGLPTMGLFAYPDLLVKNPPFCTRSRSILFTDPNVSIESIANQFVSFVWGNQCV